MPAATESVYRIPSLTPDVLNNGASGIISEDIYDSTIQPLIDELIAKGVDPTTPFDPAKHLTFTDEAFKNTTRLTLDDLKVTETHQTPLSNIGVSSPFPLFSDEAIDIMRYEILFKEGLLHSGRISDVSNTGDMDFYLRGNCHSHMPFTYAAWHHPTVLGVMSKLCEVELQNMTNYECGNSNITIKQKTTQLIESGPENVEDEDPDKIAASVTWHYDSPQFVCVLMLSDTSKMIGGETALLMGNGKVAKAAGPKRGYATILQGRVLRHIATKPKGDFTERIVSVASFRPVDPLKDNCFMTTIKPTRLRGSRYNDFYKDWMDYRLDVLSERIAIFKKQLNEKYEKGEYFDQFDAVDFIQKNIIEYAEHTYQEFEAVDDGLIPKPASYNAVKARWD